MYLVNVLIMILSEEGSRMFIDDFSVIQHQSLQSIFRLYNIKHVTSYSDSSKTI